MRYAFTICVEETMEPVNPNCEWRAYLEFQDEGHNGYGATESEAMIDLIRLLFETDDA